MFSVLSSEVVSASVETSVDSVDFVDSVDSLDISTDFVVSSDTELSELLLSLELSSVVLD